MPNCVEGRKYFFLPVNTGYVDGRLPDDRCYEFYVARSGHGLYCSIVGNVVIPNGYGSNDVCAEISSSERWRRLARGIEECGARPGIQLSSAWREFEGIRPFLARDKENAIADYKAVMAGMSTHDIRETIGNLRRGTELALRAGFSHIQLHAAHGYLFSLLIDDAFCQHSEFVLDALASWARDVDSASGETSLRFSVLTGDQTTDEAGWERLTDRLVALPFSFFDVTAGFYNINKQLIYPSTKELLSFRRDATVALAHRFANKQIILSGKSNGAWDTSLPRNVHIGICRDLIANPNFLRDRAMGCNNCMKCHYYSRGARDLTCGRWETESGGHRI